MRIEGLATYVSHVLNPQADEKELLLTSPDDMAVRTRAVLPAALADLDNALGKDDAQTYANLFMKRGTDAMPRRRGYYLGSLVAQEAGTTRDVRQLANMSCDEVKPLVFATVDRLRENARQSFRTTQKKRHPSRCRFRSAVQICGSAGPSTIISSLFGKHLSRSIKNSCLAQSKRVVQSAVFRTLN